jgi:hypothetical protein
VKNSENTLELLLVVVVVREREGGKWRKKRCM